LCKKLQFPFNILASVWAQTNLGGFDMSEGLRQTEGTLSPELSFYAPQAMGRVTVLEALAEDTELVGPSRSNQSTAPQGDLDDQ
jgi:hypothetical protein